MSRPLRILYPDAWYHVMNRGRRRERLFKDVKDFKSFLILLKESVDLWGVRVAGYPPWPFGSVLGGTVVSRAHCPELL